MSQVNIFLEKRMARNGQIGEFEREREREEREREREKERER